MGIYMNPDNKAFQLALNSEIYVDKTGMIVCTNKVINTENRFVCVSRPRRFGKSMAANMLVAYYSKGCDSREMFSGLKISSDESFEKYINKYNVIRLNIIDFLSEAADISEMIKFIEEDILDELEEEFSNIKMPRRKTLIKVLETIFVQTKVPFIFVIDEWDCIFRKKNIVKEDKDKYLDFLRNIFKDKTYAALVYMTGILPIKKYGEHSALNMFTEISMTDAQGYAEFTGFTEDEVEGLCRRYEMSFDDTKRWYDGYNVDGISIYNPRSVVMSMSSRKYNNYWTSTETYEALKMHIKGDTDGIKDKVSAMVAGDRVKVNTAKFQNDMTQLETSDDILTLLVHLGYLTYELKEAGQGEVWIPNGEVQQEFINSIEDGGWEELMKSINASDKLLEATLNGDSEKVAEMIAESHNENTSILQYNDENSLACVISIAYYSARNKYIMHRELATGKGYADITFIPRKNTDSPAIVVELKHNKSAVSAIEQIKAKKYTDKISEYTGEIILVGINYDDDKGHTCVIERVIKYCSTN